MSTNEPAGLRVLVFLHSLGYVRFFDPVIRELLARGHRVHLVFERDDHDANEDAWLAEMAGVEGFTFAWTQALRRDPWWRFGRQVRKAADLVRFYSPDLRGSGFLFARAEHRAPDWVPCRHTHATRQLAARPRAAGVGARRRGERDPESGLRRTGTRRLDPGSRRRLPPHDARDARLRLRQGGPLDGLRTAICIASWDNLSSKQLIHELPDRLIVWNETQRREAVDLHRVPSDRIVVTGAQPSTTGSHGRRGRAPSSRTASASTRAGRTCSMSAARCSRRRDRGGMGAPLACRAAERPRACRVGVLFRPHPKRSGDSTQAAFDGFDNVVIWPTQQDQMPIDEERRADYFDSIHHSTAVFGLNTSAMIEAAVVGRPVHTMLAPEFATRSEGCSISST